jgi:hypothetical protein
MVVLTLSELESLESSRQIKKERLNLRRQLYFNRTRSSKVAGLFQRDWKRK